MTLVRKLNISRFDYLHRLLFFRYIRQMGYVLQVCAKFEALIFLENALILKVVVYLGVATAMRSGIAMALLIDNEECRQQGS